MWFEQILSGPDFRLKDEDIKEVADKHNVEIGTILISYQGKLSILLLRIS